MLLFKGFAVESLVHPLDIFSLLGELLLFSLLRSLRLADAAGDLLACRFHIVKRRLEVDVDVCFDDTDLVLGLAVHDVDLVVSTPMIDVDGVTLEDTRVVRELSLKNSFWIWKVDERSLMGLELDVSTLL